LVLLERERERERERKKRVSPPKNVERGKKEHQLIRRFPASTVRPSVGAV